jgi:1,4-dihydroxy-6-naphthoate synthase
VTRVRLGISTCPNDTFAFHALLAGEVRAEGLELAIELGDIEELNGKLATGALDAAKVSFHAALLAGDDWVVLPSGSALGFGVGPLLLAAPGRGDDPFAGTPRVLSPGARTTAELLWKLFHAGDVEGRATLERAVFSDILPALAARRADLGLCIHEARFTWRERGVDFVEDLGQRWERATDEPLPLGGIAGRRALGPETLTRVQDAVARSLEWGLAHEDACLPTMRRYAQEQSDRVLRAHVELYVNEWTRDLGARGRAALAKLAELATASGAVPAGARLPVLDR